MITKPPAPSAEPDPYRQNLKSVVRYYYTVKPFKEKNNKHAYAYQAAAFAVYSDGTERQLYYPAPTPLRRNAKRLAEQQVARYTAQLAPAHISHRVRQAAPPLPRLLMPITCSMIGRNHSEATKAKIAAAIARRHAEGAYANAAKRGPKTLAEKAELFAHEAERQGRTLRQHAEIVAKEKAAKERQLEAARRMMKKRLTTVDPVDMKRHILRAKGLL